MEVSTDFAKARAKVAGAIKKYGYLPDHNYFNYLCTQNSRKKGMFFGFGQKKGIVAFFNRDNSTWRIINGIFAPGNERAEILARFLEYAASRGSNRVFVESPSEFRLELSKKMKNICKISLNYSMHWPVYNLGKLDEKLAGKQWKKLRNINNRFYKSFRVEIKNPLKISKKILKNILFRWTARRFPRDRANYGYYINAIDNNFKGFEELRAISLNGEVCSFSGGWMVPNSRIFYCSLGIFNYMHKDLGDFVNMDDLLHLKKMGYRYVDLGGSEKSLLHFKKKFRPERIYRTDVFSISMK